MVGQRGCRPQERHLWAVAEAYAAGQALESVLLMGKQVRYTVLYRDHAERQEACRLILSSAGLRRDGVFLSMYFFVLRLPQLI